MPQHKECIKIIIPICKGLTLKIPISHSMRGVRELKSSYRPHYGRGVKTRTFLLTTLGMQRVKGKTFLQTTKG